MGRVKNKAMFEKVAEEVQGVFDMEMKITYWGDDLVLLHGLDEDGARQLNDREQQNGRTPFISIQRWSPEMKPSHRLAWIYIWGLPLMAWDEENMAKLVSGFGELIELDEETEERSRMDVTRVLVRTKEKPNIARSLIVIVDGTMHQLEMREEMGFGWGRRKRLMVSESFPPSPFTTALAESNDELTNRISDGRSSVGFSDVSPYLRSGLLHSRRRQWARTLNLWSAETEVLTDVDIEPGRPCAYQSEAAGTTGEGPAKEDHNDPLIPNLHAYGKVDHRDVCPIQPHDREDDIANEDKVKVDTEKGTCFWAMQDDPAVITLQTPPMVYRDSNLAFSNERGTGYATMTSVEDRKDQKLGLVSKGPFPKEGAVGNVKVYVRKKEGGKGKYKAQSFLQSTSRDTRNEGDIRVLDPGEKPGTLSETDTLQPQPGPTHTPISNSQYKEAQEGRDFHTSDPGGPIPQQQHPSHSPGPSNDVSKVFSDKEEAFHMAIARELGVSYCKSNNSKDNTLNEDNSSRCSNDLTGLMGMKQIEP